MKPFRKLMTGYVDLVEAMKAYNFESATKAVTDCVNALDEMLGEDQRPDYQASMRSDLIYVCAEFSWLSAGLNEAYIADAFSVLHGYCNAVGIDFKKCLGEK